MAKSIVSKIKKHEVVEVPEPNLETTDSFEEVDEEWKVDDSEKPLQGLIDAIEEGYRKDNVPKHMKKKTFAPSSLVWNHGVCPRYWYLAFEGNTFFEYKTGKMITNMDSGTDRHTRIQKALEDSGILIDNERKTTYEDPPIFGYVDSFIEWKDAEYVVEIKTCNADAFERYRAKNKPASYHVIQLLIYMKIYKKKSGIILYENKNTHDLLALPVNINQDHVDFMNYLFDWMREVYAAWTDKKLPEVPFRSNDIKICQNCPLQQACKDAPKGDIKIARRKDEKGLF
jgi:CRISPR/Cas system-associated exonuclease Cas4 (RecB family)